MKEAMMNWVFLHFVWVF